MSRFPGVRWRLAGAFFLIVLALVTLVGLYLLEWTESYYTRSVAADLSRESRAVGRFATAVPSGDLPGAITKLGRDLGHRITIVKPDGTVIADSEHDYRQMPNHSDRPEISRALGTGYGTATRYSATLKTDMLYVATRSGRDGTIDGVVRVAEPLSGLREVLSTIQETFLLAGLVALIVAALLSLKLASSITTPVLNIADAARRLADGDLGARTSAPEKPGEEIGSLAKTFNHMAGELQAMVQELNEQKAQMQTVFDRTDDGLILVGQHERIQMVNPVACRMLGIDCENALGKTVIEGTLSHELSSLVERVARTREPAALDIAPPIEEKTAILAYVAPVIRTEGAADTLIVLHDVTASRQLDAVRRDFVANVSHELRTPLASIKAMAETIILRQKSDPSVAAQFAGSIVEEADRMTQLAEDLLDLAKIESGSRPVSAGSTDLRQLVDDVMERLSTAAEKKSIELVSEVGDGEFVRADHDSVAQILVNLVDNAIKYSHDGGRVVISAERVTRQIAIRVSDNGIGIPKDDLPRVFERFYRVDRARSRQSGGTGLGLSIVKHLTELLGGSVSVTSEPDRGTTFTVKLPQA